MWVETRVAAVLARLSPLLLQTNLTALTPASYLLSFPMLTISAE